MMIFDERVIFFDKDLLILYQKKMTVLWTVSINKKTICCCYFS